MTPIVQSPLPTETATEQTTSLIGNTMTTLKAPAPPLLRSAAPDPIRDRARLAALRDLDLIDNGPDEAIDRFTRLAGELLQVPVSLVSLLDADHQFVISKQGLASDWAIDRQTPLNHTFCQFAVIERAPMVVDDTRLHPLLSDTAASREGGVIAYAAIPLILADGNAVGTLCAIDENPREWSADELRTLEDLAAAIVSVMDLRAGIAQRGLHDRLTGLPNRDYLVAYTDQLLERRFEDESVAVMCAGLDHFSQINQAIGTDDADGVLKLVAERFAEIQGPDQILGRLRGDVFTLVAPGIRDEDQAREIAEAMRDALIADPVTIGRESLTVSATVGIAVCGSGARGADMMSEAANAMHEAKKHRDGVWISDDGWSARAADQVRMRDALRVALARDEIHAVFQPILELEGNALRGFEALARWDSAELGEISPADFIPLAELTGDIIPIGRWMMEEAAAQIALWRDEVDPKLVVTVNVSPLELQQAGFADDVAAILARHDIPGEALGIEITEGGLMETAAIEQSNLRRLKQMGVYIVLDDFGTGYSALSYLRHFPIDSIKIDRSFVEACGEDRASTSLVQAMLTMSRGMEMEVVAEGIETEEQARLLRLLGCPYGQGYLFARPAAADTLRLH
jgi:diguanylate cyclase (GGDEF)-like protein